MERINWLWASVFVGALGFAGCGASAEAGDQGQHEETDQVTNGAHQDNDGNDPFKPKRCPPGKVEGSDPGDCPPGHQ